MRGIPRPRIFKKKRQKMDAIGKLLGFLWVDTYLDHQKKILFERTSLAICFFFLDGVTYEIIAIYA